MHPVDLMDSEMHIWVIMRIMFLSLLLLATSWSQAQPRGDVTPDYLRERLAEVTPHDKGLPEDLLSLNDERVAITAELVRLADYLKGRDFSREIRALESAKQLSTSQLAELVKTDCKALKGGTFSPPLRGLNQVGRVIFANDLEDIENPWALAPNQREMVALSAQAQCERWKAFVSPQTQAQLIGYFDLLTTRIQENAKSASEATNQVKQLSDLLKKRREAVQQKLSKQTTKSELTDKLWLALGVIGAFSIGMLFMVRQFETSIQIEWVASGQVIQFATVMILLSVVMALGLSGILKEESLGTLLGGIAGYVLAQGVGRAAAREVSRRTGPPPPAPDAPAPAPVDW